LIRIEYHEKRYPRLLNGELIAYIGFEYLNVMFYGLHSQDCIALDGRMMDDDELEQTWKEAVMS
jgi:hypothetical protein